MESHRHDGHGRDDAGGGGRDRRRLPRHAARPLPPEAGDLVDVATHAVGGVSFPQHDYPRVAGKGGECLFDIVAMTFLI